MIHDDDAELLRVYPLLLTAAKEEPGAWQPHILESGWKVAALCDAVTHRMAVRFRAMQHPGYEWVEFLMECRRRAALLGIGDWKFGETQRRLFFEADLKAPALPSAQPSEAA